MAKKKPEIGLTDQLEILVEIENKAAIKQAKKDQRHVAARIEKELAKGIKRLNVAIKQASERLVFENTTAGAELIEITDGEQRLRFERFDTTFQPVTIAVSTTFQVAAWVNQGLALVPEHYRLAAPLGAAYISSFDELWFFTDPSTLLEDLLMVDEGASDGLTEHFVDPIVEWLDGLGRSEPKSAKTVVGA